MTKKRNKLVKLETKPNWLTKSDKEDEVKTIVENTVEEDNMIHVSELKPVPKLEHEIQYTEENKDLLYRLLQFRTHSRSKTQDLFISKLRERFDMRGGVTELDSYGNLYVTKGKADFYPCAIAHTDINQRVVNDPRIMESYPFIFGFDNDTASQCGLGADDKVGVFFCCLMFDRFDNIKLFFPKDEEVGLIGTGAANKEFFSDCSMLVQLDRRSYSNDLINNTNGVQVFDSEFEDAVTGLLTKYNYKVATGVCTDVGAIKRFDTVKCVGMNVSCGYIDEHSSTEVISIPHMINALNFGYEIMKMGIDKVWEHKTVSETYSYGSYGGYGGYSSYGGYYGSTGYDWDDNVYYGNSYGSSYSSTKESDTKVNTKSDGSLSIFDKFDLASEMMDDTILNEDRDLRLPDRYVIDSYHFAVDIDFVPNESVILDRCYLDTDEEYTKNHSYYYNPKVRPYSLTHRYIDPDTFEEKIMNHDGHEQLEIDKSILNDACPCCGTYGTMYITNSLLLDVECWECGSIFNQV